MKNNKKGFISITVIYSFFILFITIMLLIMYSYINDRKMNNKIKSDLLNSIRDKTPQIIVSMNGSVLPHPSYTVNVQILDGGNGIASVKYIWSPSPIDTPETNLPSYNEDLASPVQDGYYFLIIKACDVNDNCKTAVTNYFKVGQPYICMKATTLHNETCTNSDDNGYCLKYGLSENSVITYGLINSGVGAKVGDAYDCDVNGDGTYDPLTERFYYVGDYFDTSTKTYDAANAALIYYANVHNENDNVSSTIAYTTGNDLTPATAYQELPSSSKWSNVSLISSQRNIVTTSGNDQLVKEYFYTGDYQTFKAEYTGNYVIELWGAQGGSVDGAAGGKGAYTVGTISLNKDDILYIYVGGEGKATTKNVTENADGGYNGGGGSGGDGWSRSFGSGGGATDIRLVSGLWNDTESLASRIMVAAGGGGAYSGYHDGDRFNDGGYAGTLTGGNGSHSTGHCYGEGGTQVAGGIITASTASCESTYPRTPQGGFGYGGAGTSSKATGGGGGYYGGSRSGHIASAGGGSSYISGQIGCISIKSDQLIEPLDDCIQPTFNIECSYHYSGKRFTKTDMAAGNEEMPTHDGITVMIGNEGNGYAKISYEGTIENPPVSPSFTYTNKVSRLLTYKELKDCFDYPSFVFDQYLQAAVKNECSFLFENTKFTDSSRVEGYFLESPYDEDGTIWVLDSEKNTLYSGVSKTVNNKYGVRPVIEVSKELIQP